MKEKRPSQLQRLTIEKLVYGGDGLARMAGPDNRSHAVFLPFVLPGEEVDAVLYERRKNFVRAEVERICLPSPDRAVVPCPYFQRCGGCHLQHATYAGQLQNKAAILKETLERTGKLQNLPEIQILSADPWQYRNRVRLHVEDGRPGYLGRRAHSVIPITVCPISAALIERTIAALHNHSLHGIAQIELFVNHDESQLLLSAWPTDATGNLEQTADTFLSMIQKLSVEIPQLRGALLRRLEEEIRSNAETTYTQALEKWGEASLAYQVCGHTYQVSVGTFFQTNLKLLNSFVETVTAESLANLPRTAWDLYAGCGLFSVPLASAGVALKVVEISRASCRDLLANLAGFPAAEAIESSVPAFLERALAERQPAPDLVLVDPPRGGLENKVAELLARIAPPDMVYVSCDPATLSRDLRVLVDSGYQLQRLYLADMFPQTFHIESIAVLRK